MKLNTRTCVCKVQKNSIVFSLSRFSSLCLSSHYNHTTCGGAAATAITKISQITGKGKGVIAQCDIAENQTIITEDALFSIALCDADAIDHQKAASKLNHQITTEITTQVEQLTLMQPNSLFNLYFMKQYGNNIAVAIFSTNVWSSSATGRSGLYPRISRLNHSCNPNAIVTDDEDGEEQQQQQQQRLVVKAKRDVKCGEELLLNYLGDDDVKMGTPFVERRRKLEESWDFLCTCDRCCEEEEAAAAENVSSSGTELCCERAVCAQRTLAAWI